MALMVVQLCPFLLHHTLGIGCVCAHAPAHLHSCRQVGLGVLTFGICIVFLKEITRVCFQQNFIPRSKVTVGFVVSYQLYCVYNTMLFAHKVPEICFSTNHPSPPLHLSIWYALLLLSWYSRKRYRGYIFQQFFLGVQVIMVFVPKLSCIWCVITMMFIQKLPGVHFDNFFPSGQSCCGVCA